MTSESKRRHLVLKVMSCRQIKAEEMQNSDSVYVTKTRGYK